MNDRATYILRATVKHEIDGTTDLNAVITELRGWKDRSAQATLTQRYKNQCNRLMRATDWEQLAEQTRQKGHAALTGIFLLLDVYQERLNQLENYIQKLDRKDD